MRKLKLSIILIAAIFTAVLFADISAALAKDSEFIGAFREALYAGDNDKMSKLIDDNLEAVSAEVDAYILEISKEDMPAEDRETGFFLLEMLTTKYKDKTRDPEPLKAFKRTYFESKLSAPIRSKKKGGVHHVEFSMAEGDLRDKFRPDNIIINAGDTVRWTNNNEIAHLFATSMFIGEKGIFTPSIKPGETWEYIFTKPGNYYLVCFVHVGMIAKVKVLGEAEPEEVIPDKVIDVDDEPSTSVSDGIPLGVQDLREPLEDSEDGFMDDKEDVMLDDLDDDELIIDEPENGRSWPSLFNY